MDHQALDDALRVFTDPEVTLADAVLGYARSMQQAAALVGVELAAVDVDTDTVRVVLRLRAAPDLQVHWNPVLGWIHQRAPSVGEDTGEPHQITYRVGAENDAASLVPDPDVVAGWLAALADGERGGHREPPERATPDDPALLAALAAHGRPGGMPGTTR